MYGAANLICESVFQFLLGIHFSMINPFVFARVSSNYRNAENDQNAFQEHARMDIG